MATIGAQRIALPSIAPTDVNALRSLVFKLLSDRKRASQQAYKDDYGSASLVDLHTLPPIPIGDDNDAEYDKLHVGVAGVLGGGRRRKTKSRKARKSRKHQTRKARKSNKSRKARKPHKAHKSRKARK
jgi:hypothetical protein